MTVGPTGEAVKLSSGVACAECGHAERAGLCLCLRCHTVHCSRSIEAHMVQHGEAE